MSKAGAWTPCLVATIARDRRTCRKKEGIKEGRKEGRKEQKEGGREEAGRKAVQRINISVQ